MRRSWRWWVIGLFWAGHAWGQDDVASARAIASEGIEAFDAGDYQTAEEKLGLAYEAVQVPTIALYRARALDRLGRLVEASEVYLECSRIRVEAGQKKAQQKVQGDCAAERAELRPRIPRLTVVVEGAPGPVTFELDGRAVNAALLKGGHLVDPGQHEIVAAAGGQQVSAELTLGEAQQEIATLEFEPGQRGKRAKTGASERGDGAERAGSGRNALRTVGWVGAGVGGGLLVFGTIEGVRVATKKKDLEDSGCRDASCYTTQGDEVDSYNRARTLSTVGFVAGGVLLATGVSLALTTRTKERAGGATVRGFVGPGSVSVEGRF